MALFHYGNSYSFRYSGNHIVSRQRPPDPLQLELAHGLDCDGVLNLHQNSGADEDLPRLGFIAEARGNIGYRPDGGIVETAFKADSAERSEAVRYSDTEAYVVGLGGPWRLTMCLPLYRNEYELP